MNLKQLFGRLNQRKVKVFAIFLLCSFFAWTLSQLSENYESRANFKLEFKNFPDSLLLDTKESHELGLKLRASGFKFLGYGLNQGKLRVNLSKINHDDTGYFLTQAQLKPQFEKQLSNSISLLELDNDKVYLPLYQVALKEVPIVPNITLDLKQNHILEGKLDLNPAIAVLKGPSQELAGVDKIVTTPHVFTTLSSNFSKKLDLVTPDELKNTVLITPEVTVKGKVVRFSEKEFTVPVKAVNVPQRYKARIFPAEVQLVCKASVNVLKELKASDFEVVVDYANANTTSNMLPLTVRVAPESVYSISLLQRQVEFLLEGL